MQELYKKGAGIPALLLLQRRIMKKVSISPISKLVATIILSTNMVRSDSDLANFLIVCWFALFYILFGRAKSGLKTLGFYGILLIFIHYGNFKDAGPIATMFVTVIFIVKIFFIPMMAGAFLVKTTDVGAMVSAMDKLHAPKALSIPIATMFRFFPAFQEEKKNIKFAMKMRGITLKNPIAYIEHVFVPMLTISSDMADDISAYAETKALADPCKKIRLHEHRFGIIDLIFVGFIVVCLVVFK